MTQLGKLTTETSWPRTLFAALIFAVLVGAYAGLAKKAKHPVVVYCAHDAVYAQAVLTEFTRVSGVPVAVKYDTEATKSLGLQELLAREGDRPRCHVFWNNELLGTAALKEKGLLAPYRGTGWARMPDLYKDPDGTWTGFAARLRVYIVNRRRLDPTPDAVDRALSGDLARVAIARPLFGTTLTHYSVLWELWGEPRLKAWHRGILERRIQVVTGNAHVKNLVAAGVCDVGFTDSDDFFAAVDDGKPVAMLPVKVDGGRVILIPNTVSLTRHPSPPPAARALVDFLLSERVERLLACSPSRQIPLGPVDEAALPAEVREMKRLVSSGYPLARASRARTDCLAWLKGAGLP